MITAFEIPNGVSGIYCAIHRESGMCYVGKSVNIRTRRWHHIDDARKGARTCFHRAIRKFGEDAFDFEILERCDREKLLEREQFYIALLGAATVAGFNTRQKGWANYGWQPDDSTRSRMSLAQKGRKHSHETIEKIRQASSRHRHSPETLAKIAAASTGRKKPPLSVKITAEKNRGKKRPIEARIATSLALLGRKRRKEDIAKMMAGRVASREARLALILDPVERDKKRARLIRKAAYELQRIRRAALIKGVIAAPVAEEKALPDSAAEITVKA